MPVHAHFSASVIWYFIYGLSSGFILIFYQIVVRVFAEKKVNAFLGLTNFGNFSMRGFLLCGLLLITSQLNLSQLNIFNIRKETMRDIVANFYLRPFSIFNRVSGQGTNFIMQISGSGVYELDRFSRPLRDFRDSLHNFMVINSLSRKNSLLFIPKEIYTTRFVQFGGKPWASGLLAYAVTGVPLVHGIESLGRTFGFFDYDESALWTERNLLDNSRVCGFGKYIIIVEDFDGQRFTLVDCGELATAGKLLK